jgi:hypothetical protein
MSDGHVETGSTSGQDRHEGRMLCPKCGHDRLRRTERKGLFELNIFPLFGFYPWECSNCRNHFFFRKRRQHNHRTHKGKRNPS